MQLLTSKLIRYRYACDWREAVTLATISESGVGTSVYVCYLSIRLFPRERVSSFTSRRVAVCTDLSFSTILTISTPLSSRLQDVCVCPHGECLDFFDDSIQPQVHQRAAASASDAILRDLEDAGRRRSRGAPFAERTLYTRCEQGKRDPADEYSVPNSSCSSQIFAASPQTTRRPQPIDTQSGRQENSAEGVIPAIESTTPR